MLIVGRSIVADRFGRAAQTYSDYADVQERAALLLAKDLHQISPRVPSGPILEIGCGTGFFSQQLIEHLSQKNILLSDIAPDMVKVCRSRIQSPNVKFAVLDAETSRHWPQQFALIASAFGAQWFKDLSTTFDGIYNALVPGGYFIFSVPTNESFSEWRTLCAGENLSYTGNHLPNENKFRAFWSQRTDSFELRTHRIQTKYPTSIEFFRALKSIGATTSTNAAFSSTEDEVNSGKPASNLRRIIKRWDKSTEGPIVVTYEVMCGIVRRSR
jgi:malonyl-CoA O-methyltransferase